MCIAARVTSLRTETYKRRTTVSSLGEDREQDIQTIERKREVSSVPMHLHFDFAHYADYLVPA